LGTNQKEEGMKRVIRIKAPENGNGCSIQINAVVESKNVLCRWEVERIVDKLTDELCGSLRTLPFASWYAHQLKVG
jgi:hypothetical protein